MASTNKCEYCGSTITSEDQTCPNCGASNPLYVADTPRRITDPKTIEELQEYCAERGMPLLRMRFFIGQDFKEPKAFGIYRENSNEFVVYKNKADGSRAERYRGPDEARAVKEIFDKLMQECYSRGIYPDGKPADTRTSGYRSGGSGYNNGNNGFRGLNGKLSVGRLILIIIIIAVLLRLFGGFTTGSILSNLFSNNSGYSSSYNYDSGNNGYYGDNGSNGSVWWNSDDDDDDYNSSSWWDSDDNDSSWWSSDDDDDSWSNDSSWDSDWGDDWSDWDSGGTDWDSDW